MEDNQELLPIDVLAYITEDLQGRYQSVTKKADWEKVFDEFLERWETDVSLEPIKKMQLEFEKDLEWFNVNQPLSLQSLRGKMVVLDFFTYCCINCMHVLPELRALEERFPVEAGLAVVGVHSPKFENERSSENILSAAQRYGIKHPIVNDPRSSLWRSIGIRCWPSLVVLRPDGLPLLLLMGEGHGVFLERFIDVALKYFERQQKISSASLPLQNYLDSKPASNLRFPAKIARSTQGLYAIADAGNNRILVISANGVVQHKVGGFETGFVDGDFTAARFNCPQGVAFFDEDTLIVADTENHALRQITLSKSLVETLAGTGHQGNDRTGGRVGPLQPISSPWDVAIFRTRDMDMSFHLDEKNVPEKTIILISMAGTHQIWGYFPEGIIWWKFRKFEPRCCVTLIGNGLEENRNNSYPQNAAFAQPSGLAMAKDFLFIADSESSSIRKASMVDGKVLPVVGGDRNPLNLFAFGDVDGKQFGAKLQHPLAVAYNHANDKVYVADTYNHKLKVIDPATNSITTLLTKNEDGQDVHFNEPAGICVDQTGQNLLVANTNNHKIQLVNLKTLLVSDFVLDFSQTAAATETDSPNNFRNALQLLHRMSLFRSENIGVKITIALTDDLKFTDAAPQKWTLQALNPVFYANKTSGRVENGEISLLLKRYRDKVLQTIPGLEGIKFDISLNLCDAKTCLMKRFSLLLHDDAAGGDQSESLKENIDRHINLYIDKTKINLR